MIAALRTGDPDAVATALAAFRGHKVPETHETHDPPESLSASLLSADETGEIEEAGDRVWQDDEGWWTDFPPPDRFDGIERQTWGDYGYQRTCTGEETALMEAIATVDLAEERAADDAQRHAYFAEIAADLAAEEAAADPPPPSSRT